MGLVSGGISSARFRFETDAPELAAYATEHLSPLSAAGHESVAVSSVLRWHDAQPPRRETLGIDLDLFARVDRDLYVSDTRAIWLRVDDLRDLVLRFNLEGERLQVEGDFYFRVGNSAWRDRLRRAVSPRQVDAMRRRRFTTLLSYLVYYPCWWWLEHLRDLHPIHAGGVEVDGKVILLAGASGVGKSTLTVALAGLANARLLSDSFVLQSGGDVWAVPEPILIDDWSRRWVGAAADLLEPMNFPYMLGRRGHLFPRNKRVDHGRAGLLVFPRRAPEPSVHRLSPDQAHQRLSAVDMIINDLRRYFAFAAVLEQLAPGGLVAHREANIARLTSEIPCYEIGLTKNMTSQEATETIVRLLSGQHLRVVAQRP